ncbi:hypothetical protein COSO111634_27465 [Corallococcus soli]
MESCSVVTPWRRSTLPSSSRSVGGLGGKTASLLPVRSATHSSMPEMSKEMGDMRRNVSSGPMSMYFTP